MTTVILSKVYGSRGYHSTIVRVSTNPNSTNEVGFTSQETTYDLQVLGILIEVWFPKHER